MEQKTKNEKPVWEKKTKLKVLILNIVTTISCAWILISNWQLLPISFERYEVFVISPVAFVVFGWLGFFLRRRGLVKTAAIFGLYSYLLYLPLLLMPNSLVAVLALLIETICYFYLSRKEIRLRKPREVWTQRFREKVRILNWILTIVAVLLCWKAVSSLQQDMDKLLAEAQKLKSYQIFSTIGIAGAMAGMGVAMILIYVWTELIVLFAWLGYRFKRRGLLWTAAILVIPIWPLSIAYIVLLVKNPLEVEEVALTEPEDRTISREKDNFAGNMFTYYSAKRGLSSQDCEMVEIDKDQLRAMTTQSSAYPGMPGAPQVTSFNVNDDHNR